MLRPGRHSLEFARRGFRVTGADRTARYLETARAAATREGLTVEFVQEGALLSAAGFSTVQLYGSLAGTPYDQTAQRLVDVATK